MSIRSLRVLALASALAACASPAPIELRDMGSFHVGGREVAISGMPVKEVVFSPGGVPAKVDPNGAYQVEQMYVQYFLPVRERGTVPLLLWHGGSLTGVSYETTPVGHPGWLNYFVKQGWATFNSDAVERGRAGWAQYPDEPIFLTKANPFERFRIGQGQGSYNRDVALMKPMPGTQFPIEAYENFTRQLVPRWTSSDAPTIAAYTLLVDRICPCVIVFHSQAGQFAFKVAQARPDKVKALVAVEPTSGGDPAQAAALKGMPILAVFGDNIDRDARWPTIRANVVKFIEAAREAGGRVEIRDLPKAGIRGNSHMMMMDKNNLEVADVIQTWLEREGLWH
jgi:hypothetical protein